MKWCVLKNCMLGIVKSFSAFITSFEKNLKRLVLNPLISTPMWFLDSNHDVS